MMKLTSHSITLLGLLLLSCGAARAQAATGTPPFGAFGGGPFDTVNLANANVHFSIPVLSKAGRGLPFTYSLGYDTSVWYPATVSGTTSWQPVQNWGWIAETEGATGTLNASFTSGCVQYYGCYYAYYNYVYVDAFGAPHPINFSYTGLYGCNGVNYGSTPPPSCPSSDGSGWALIANYSSSPGYNYMANAQGRFLIPPTNSNTGTAGETDSNGNQISINSSGVFTDTLGTTALTITGSNPVTLQYTAPSGSPVNDTVKYTSYTVKTNFGCGGVTEYGPTAQNLVSEIDLPDGSKYTFTYEATPGYSGDVTGRLASVTLPTGGTISYAYSGGSNGITCADGTAATVTRTTPDGQWVYAHTESGAAWQTVITPPAYNNQTNQTTMNFEGIYPTESQTTQNGSTLETVYTCYNGAAKPCNSTAITLPITQRTTYVDLPTSSGTLEAETNTYYDTETCPGGGGTCSNGRVSQNYQYDYSTSGLGPLLRRTVIAYQDFTTDIGMSH